VGAIYPLSPCVSIGVLWDCFTFLRRYIPEYNHLDNPCYENLESHTLLCCENVSVHANATATIIDILNKVNDTL
jgi:hypothetical protein